MTTLSELAWWDQQQARVVEAIRQHGVFVTYVGGVCDCPVCGGDPDQVKPPFAYTTGLFGIAHPELVLYSSSPGTACSVLDALAERVRDGRDLMVGEVISDRERSRQLFVQAVPDPSDIVCQANAFYQRPPEASVPAYQLTMSDDDGRFPWDEGCTLPPDCQPRLE